MTQSHFTDFYTYNKERSMTTKRTFYILDIMYPSILVISSIQYGNLHTGTVTSLWGIIWIALFYIPITTFLGRCMSIYSGVHNNQSKYFRARYSPLSIFALIVSIFGVLSAISTFSSTVKIQVLTTDKNAIYYTTVICGYLIAALHFIASIFAIDYIKKWRQIYRFEFEELELSEEGKSNLIYREKVEYKKHKAEQKEKLKKYGAEQKETNRQQTITRRTEQKEQLKEKQQEIKTNLQNVKNKIVNTTVTSIASRTHSPQMTKLDKLKELDDLLKNNVITQAEYDVARRDILGQ